MNDRKIVQMIACGDEMFALCDDDSIWQLVGSYDNNVLVWSWNSIPSIPPRFVPVNLDAEKEKQIANELKARRLATGPTGKRQQPHE